MIFIDTNLLIYYTLISFDIDKHRKSKEIIEPIIQPNELFISPLVLSEYVFTLSKLKANIELITAGKDTFKDFCNCIIDKDTILESVELGIKLNTLNSINDLIHMKIAKKYCDKLITFDKGFKRLINHTNIKIQILE